MLKLSTHYTDDKMNSISHSPIDATRVALILETRPIPHLPALLTHFISVLPSPWLVRFVGSASAITFLSSSKSLSQHIASGKLKLTLLPPQYAISDAEAISVTLTDLSFYKEFLAPAEWLLVFQSDSVICASSERSIEDWVAENYTYVGAPWNLGNPWGGNGGLSLRHVPPIISLLENVTRIAQSEWEDRWLSDHLGEMDPVHMPNPEIERYFSVESVWTERPFGYHLRGSGKLLDASIWGNETRRNHVLEYCPEIKLVLDMELRK